MSEQSRIPLNNARPVEAGSSLFERASGAFGLDALKPVAPPRDLPRAPVQDAPKPPAPPRTPIAQEQTVPDRPTPSPTQPQHGRVGFSGSSVRLDRDRMRENGMIDPDGPVTALLEEFRIVKRDLLGDARKSESGLARRILVCSPHPGEGKTYCSINLAISMAAERDIEVLLVDADFANPSVPRVLGFDAGRGFMDALADPSIAPESLVVSTDIRGLFILPAGRSTTNDAEYIASARTGELLDRLTQGAPNRVLIFDTPPALAASPAAELAKHVGQALLVARADMTGQSSLEDACQLLSACPEIKLLLNATQFSPSGRTFGAYEGYGS
ncbi:MAG: capsular biosynthesis protein [Alphaproteobacteria bacterium]|nr:MAG: capsular biosynthesis protein [Alphaproteobacteria bacterium]